MKKAILRFKIFPYMAIWPGHSTQDLNPCLKGHEFHNLSRGLHDNFRNAFSLFSTNVVTYRRISDSLINSSLLYCHIGPVLAPKPLSQLEATNFSVLGKGHHGHQPHAVSLSPTCVETVK